MSVDVVLLAPTITAFVAGGGLWLFAHRIKQRRSIEPQSAPKPATAEAAATMAKAVVMPGGGVMVYDTGMLPHTNLGYPTGTLYERLNRLRDQDEIAGGTLKPKIQIRPPREKADKS